jgi:hypothetical protein
MAMNEMKDENDSYLKPGQKDENDSYVGTMPVKPMRPGNQNAKDKMKMQYEKMASGKSTKDVKKNALKKALGDMRNTPGMVKKQMGMSSASSPLKNALSDMRNTPSMAKKKMGK